ncbi:unnamed protein product, partial [Allacma fusca]
MRVHGVEKLRIID